MVAPLSKREMRGVSLWEPFRLAREEMESLWSQMIGEPIGNVFRGRMLPALDLSETPATIEVRVDLPGIKPEEIDIQLKNGVLKISGERAEEKEVRDKTFHREERHYGCFSRSISLPASVKEEKVDAQYHDGVLTVTLRKTEEAKSRKIEVRT